MSLADVLKRKECTSTGWMDPQCSAKRVSKMKMMGAKYIEILDHTLNNSN